MADSSGSSGEIMPPKDSPERATSHPPQNSGAASLSPCPRFPWSCVCSRESAGERQRVEPLAITGDPVAAFDRLKKLVAELPRTDIVEETDAYLHAECRSPKGFVDDLECRLCPSAKLIHVRSAARIVLLWDMGVNRARVETLRQGLDSAASDAA